MVEVVEGAKSGDLSQAEIYRFIVDNCKNIYLAGYTRPLRSQPLGALCYWHQTKNGKIEFEPRLLFARAEFQMLIWFEK